MNDNQEVQLAASASEDWQSAASNYAKLLKIVKLEIPKSLWNIFKCSWIKEKLKISDNSTVQDIWGVLVKYLTDKKFQTLLSNGSNLTSGWETGRTLTNGWELIPSVLVLLFAPPELLQHFMNNPRQTEAESNSSCSSYIRNNIKRGEKERFYKVLDCLLGKILDKECKLWDPSVLILTLRFIDATPLNGTNFKRTDRFDRFEKILEIRESVFGYATSMSIPDDKFKALSDNIKHVAKALFGEDDESRINDILNSKDHTEIENLNGTLEEQKVVSYDEIVYWTSMMAEQFGDWRSAASNYAKLLKIVMLELQGNPWRSFKCSWTGSQFREILEITETSTGQDIWGVLVQYLNDQRFRTLLNNGRNLTSGWETGRTLTNGWELLPSFLVLLFAPPELLQHFMNNPHQTEAGSNSSCSSYIRNMIQGNETERFYRVLECICNNILDKKCNSWDPSVLILMHLFIETAPLNGDKFERTPPFDRIERVLLIRNSLCKYADSMSIPDDKFKALSDNIIYVAGALFGKKAERRIKNILNSKDHTEVEDQTKIEDQTQIETLNKKFKEQEVFIDIAYLKSMMARIFVHWKHNFVDIIAADQFIRGFPDGSGVAISNIMDFLITTAVSTSLGSTVLLIGKGVDSAFTRNTFSSDGLYPWQIYQSATTCQSLVSYIDKCWLEMTIDATEDRNEVNKIAPHIVYELSNDGWQQVQIANNIGSNKTVRFRLDSIVIYSHPPRDDSLTSALKAKNGYKKMKKKLVGNGKTTKDLNSLAELFTNFYKEFYEGLDETTLPTSYKWPTIQLILIRKKIKQRLGSTFAGVYDGCDDKVHHKFAAKGVEERKSPTKKEVFEQFVKGVKFEAIEEAIGHKPEV